MATWSRRRFVGGVAGVVGAGVAARLEAATRPTSRPATTRASVGPFGVDEAAFEWHDVRDWGIEGKAFTDVASHYDRLPGRAKGVVRDPVWHLSRNSAGMSAGFMAETPAVAVRYTLTSEKVAMAHMPATGVSGCDLYAKDGRERWRWVGVTRPEAQRVAGTLVKDMDVVVREYRMYLPLYNGVKQVEVGVPKGGIEVRPVAARGTEQAVVYYGTSIAQGGCVSRPGMAFTSILSRWLDRPFVNLAFSGNGKMEESVGRFLCELEPACFVIDCLPNMTVAEVKERTVPIVKQIRAVRKDVPILLVEDRTHDSQWTSGKAEAERAARRKALRDGYERLVKEGEGKLYYLKGDLLTGTDGEGTVDGSHPSDLGSMRYAEQLAPVLRKILA